MFDDVMVSVPPDFNYSSFEFKSANSQLIQETELFVSKVALLEYADNSFEFDLMMEDAIEVKNRIIEAVNKLLEIIGKLNTKFQNMALSLVAGNEKWIANIRDTVTPDTIPEDYKYSMYPYWNTTSKILNYEIPEFRESNEEFMELLKDSEKFKEKYFKDLYIEKDGKSVYDPKTAFRGGKDAKVDMNKAILVKNLDKMIDFISGYKDNIKKIVVKNTSIIDVLKRAVSIIKGAPIHESVDDFVNTINTLLEADGDEPVTTNTVNDSGTNKDDKREEGKDEGKPATSNIKDLATERQTYSKLCYEINAARMICAENVYNEYVRALMAAKRGIKKK